MAKMFGFEELKKYLPKRGRSALLLLLLLLLFASAATGQLPITLAQEEPGDANRSSRGEERLSRN